MTFQRRWQLGTAVEAAVGSFSLSIWPLSTNVIVYSCFRRLCKQPFTVPYKRFVFTVVRVLFAVRAICTSALCGPLYIGCLRLVRLVEKFRIKDFCDAVPF